MVIPTSDSEPDEFPHNIPNGAPGDPDVTVERTDPRAVLVDWFTDDTAALDDLVTELVAAYETVEDDDEGDELARRPRNEDLAETTVETVRRYLYNRKATPGRTNPRQAMNDWFSLPDAFEELPQPFTMLAVVFQTQWGLTPTELAQDAIDAIQRYLLGCAEQADG